MAGAKPAERFASKFDLSPAGSVPDARVAGALMTQSIARVTMDSTVQPKNVTFSHGRQTDPDPV
jgi:hypothetical protein